MKIELFPFQQKAQHELRKKAAAAKVGYAQTFEQQVISFTAPTGSGKTIMMAAFVESVYSGDEKYSAQSDAIFVWLSDSPELNKQSMDKFYHNADKINRSQLVMIDESFNQEILSDGRIYFLNTQKLGKSSNLTKHSDFRRYTIWETLQNTVDEKTDRLYFIIDEAHRGMKTEKRALAIATTIMQKFIKGSKEDGIEPAPLVIGMSATIERFNALVKDTSSTVHKVRVTTEEVRASGLLKDRIIVVHPDVKEKNFVSKEMAMLEAAADDWKDKCDHWRQYCREQHKKLFNPIFVVQAANGAGDKISETDLDECLRRIEARTGFRFNVGEVVHTFGQTESDLMINGLRVVNEEPSHIAANDKIKIVFFKENLSTGWDCPKAETMMSFRRATDATYIAQLLGRMIRTPLQSRIAVDDTLNDVRLYLPYFDRETARNVVEELQRSEGGEIPADVQTESVDDKNYDTWTVEPAPPVFKRDREFDEAVPVAPISAGEFDQAADFESNFNAPEPTVDKKTHTGFKKPVNAVEDILNRKGIVKAVNDAGLLTYQLRTVRISDYLKSLFKLAQLFMRTGIYPDAVDDVTQEIIGLIKEHIDGLKRSNKYDALKEQAKQFKLSAQIFDAFGKSVDNVVGENLFVTTETDIDRQFYQAEAKLKSEGIANAYLKTCAVSDELNDYKIDVILFAANNNCLLQLEQFAQKRFHALNDEYRRKVAKCAERVKKDYDRIVADSDIISEHNFNLPETIIVPRDKDGKNYRDHLFVDRHNGAACINLNGWEEGVLEEERRRQDFVCWIRNRQKQKWALCLTYEQENNETHAMYPDMLIIRRVYGEYVVDILEPHDPGRRDNIGKARGLAAYAKKNTGVGRVQLIREVDRAGFKYFNRLDMSKGEIRDKVIRASTNNELDNIFDQYGRSNI